MKYTMYAVKKDDRWLSYVPHKQKHEFVGDFLADEVWTNNKGIADINMKRFGGEVVTVTFEA